MLGGGLYHGGFTLGLGQRQQKMQPAVYTVQFHARQGRPQRRSKSFHAALVGKAHPGQVAGKIPARHKLAKCLLLKPAHRVGVGRKIPAIPPQQALRQHHAGNADAGGKAFGEGGQVYHRPVRPRHALQTGEGTRVKAEL